MKRDDCDAAYPCPCYRKTKCQLSGFEKVVELKKAGLAIYRHSSQYGEENIKTAPREDEENVFIFHNTKDADIQSADFLPEMEKRAIKCPRCRRIMDHALNILQKVSAICKNEVIGICDHCKLKQQPCCECVGAIKKFFDVKKEAKQMTLSKKRLSEFLSKVQAEVKGYFGDEKRGRTEIMKDYAEDYKKEKLRAKSDEHIDQLCRWKYVRGDRDLNIKDLYRESERRGLIKPTTDIDTAKKHIAFKDDTEIIYEPSTSMFSIERKAKSAHDEEYIKPTISTIDEKDMLTSKDEKTLEKKSGFLSPDKVQQHALDTGKQIKIYDDTRADKPIIESEQNLDGPDVSKEKDYFKIVEKKSGAINKDFVFSFPRDEKEIHVEKRQISSTELIHDVHDKIREKTEEKKRIDEETRRRKLEEEEKKLLALKEKEIRDREGEKLLQQPDYRGTGKSQIKTISSKESKSVPEIKSSTKGMIAESKLKSKSAISKESRRDEMRSEGKDTKTLRPDHKQSKTEAEAESKHIKGEAKHKGEYKDEPNTLKGEPKQLKDSKTVSKQAKGEPKQIRDDSKGEPKSPKLEPKKDSKEPKTESKRDSKQIKTESKQPKVESKGTKSEQKLDSKEPKPLKPPKSETKGEVKQTKVESKETKTESKQKVELKPPKQTGDLKEPKIDSIGVKTDKEAKTDQKDTQKSKSDAKEAKGSTKETGDKVDAKKTKGDSKEAKGGKKETGDKVDAKETKGDSKEAKGGKKETGDKVDAKETKGDSKEAKGGKKETGDSNPPDWKKFVGTPKPPSQPPPKPAPPKESKEKESKSESKEPKSATKGPKSGTKEPPDSSKPQKGDKKDESKAEGKEPVRVPKTTRTVRDDVEPPKDKKELEADMKKIEKELAEKLKAEKPPPPKIEEEPIIKYGKDIKLRSPDEPRVPRRQIEAPPPPPPKKKDKKELKVKHINMLQPSQNLLALQMVKVKGDKMKERTLSQLMTQSEIFIHLDDHKALKGERCPMCINSQLELEYESRQRQKAEMQEIIHGRNIKYVAGFDKTKDKDVVKPLLYQLKYNDQFKAEIIQAATETPMVRQFDTTQKPVKSMPEDECKGVIKYALSDRSFIEKGWTRLPTEKVVRKMNVYRMRPAHPEFDWFKRNKSKRLMTYDTGERLAEFDDDGRGRWYYKNQRMALQYYDAEELNAQQRFVIFSNGEPDERGRARPYTILATFDYLGNGVVFDHGGKIRLKYNQTEGVVLDRSIGPASHWKWHTLNDPPVLQQVMIDTQMTHKDPEILKMGAPNENLPRPDNEDMLAIEFDNFIKEKSQKLKQTFKPFQIKMKAMKINEHFSLKVLDQANVYLIYRDGTTNIKLNLGMLLDHKEIVDTDTAEVGEVSNNMERFPAKTDSLAAMQKSVAYAKHFERSRTERERRLRPAAPSASADKLTAATCKPLKPPLVAAYCSASSTTVTAKPAPKPKSRKPSSSNVYYDSRLL